MDIQLLVPETNDLIPMQVAAAGEAATLAALAGAGRLEAERAA